MVVVISPNVGLGAPPPPAVCTNALAFGKPKLLNIDEIGYLPFEPNTAHLFFRRYCLLHTHSAGEAL